SVGARGLAVDEFAPVGDVRESQPVGLRRVGGPVLGCLALRFVAGEARPRRLGPPGYVIATEYRALQFVYKSGPHDVTPSASRFPGVIPAATRAARVNLARSFAFSGERQCGLAFTASASAAPMGARWTRPGGRRVARPAANFRSCAATCSGLVDLMAGACSPIRPGANVRACPMATAFAFTPMVPCASMKRAPRFTSALARELWSLGPSSGCAAATARMAARVSAMLGGCSVVASMVSMSMVIVFPFVRQNGKIGEVPIAQPVRGELHS